VVEVEIPEAATPAEVEIPEAETPVEVEIPVAETPAEEIPEATLEIAGTQDRATAVPPRAATAETAAIAGRAIQAIAAGETAEIRTVAAAVDDRAGCL